MQSLIKDIGKIFQPLLDAVGGILAFFYSIIPNYPIDVALLTVLGRMTDAPRSDWSSWSDTDPRHIPPLLRLKQR